jgi:hypothetical protein
LCRRCLCNAVCRRLGGIARVSTIVDQYAEGLVRGVASVGPLCRVFRRLLCRHRSPVGPASGPLTQSGPRRRASTAGDGGSGGGCGRPAAWSPNRGCATVLLYRGRVRAGRVRGRADDDPFAHGRCGERTPPWHSTSGPAPKRRTARAARGTKLPIAPVRTSTNCSYADAALKHTTRPTAGRLPRYSTLPCTRQVPASRDPQPIHGPATFLARHPGVEADPTRANNLMKDRG